MSIEDESADEGDITSPSIRAEKLHVITSAKAFDLVDTLLGGADEFQSELLQYRLSSDRQADWKEEMGHQLHTARSHGYLRSANGREGLLDRVLKQVKRGTRSVGRDPNDRRHEMLAEHIAPAMVDYYLSGTGWTFGEWEPDTAPSDDVDLVMLSPSATPMNVQVKAPDRLGRVVGHRVVDGENDGHVLTALHNAAKQLPVDPDCGNMIALCAKRLLSLTSDIGFLVSDLIGSTFCYFGAERVVLPRAKLGKFFDEEWRHVSAVMTLDHNRAAATYVSTVFLNPNAKVVSRAEWFPHAYVCWFDGKAFRWTAGPPGEAHGLPDGTPLAD